MKKIFLILLLGCGISSCKKSANYPLFATERWVLIATSLQTPESLFKGGEMPWQEAYAFYSDGTFFKRTY